MLLGGFSEDYSTIENSESAEKIKYILSAGIGYATRKLGTFSLNASTEKKYDGQDIDILTAGYSKSLFNRATLFATFSNIHAEESENEFFIGITYYFGRGYSLSAGYRQSEDVNIETIKVQKNPPVGEGLGFRVSLDRTAQSDSVYSFNPSLQYNSRYGIFRGEYWGRYDEAGSNDDYQFSAAGALAYVGNTLGVTRPVADGFGVVKVGEIENVGVYVNNQEIGKTNTSGKVFIPNLNSYHDNQVSINDGDIPIDYSIPEITQYISPSLKNGAFIKFDISKIQAVTGILKVKIDGRIIPVEFQEISMMVGDKQVVFPAGRDGEFYVENVKPGKYKAWFQYLEKECAFDIIIPESDEMIIDIGEIICEDIR
jgi:outer membrane usher protein FimD/PapC